MSRPRENKAEESVPKSSPRRKRARARQVSNWLAFIRPYVDRYHALPRGEQRKYVDGISDKTGSSVNTLRRYIAAAQVLEAHGIVEFPAGLKRLPVASVEAIERISKRDPARGRELFDQLTKGLLKSHELKEKLAKMPQHGRSPTRVTRFKPITVKQLLSEVESLANAAGRAKNGIVADLKLVRFIDWPRRQGLNLLGRAALPRFVVPLPAGGGVAVIFDDSTVRWHASPAMETREFLRNVAIATTIFDYVIVVCDLFRDDVEREVAALREDCRHRVRVLNAPHRHRVRTEHVGRMTPRRGQPRRHFPE